ncbi:hypothetical protein PUNSTDRAFT_142135 [Punctularia strigosozonata HHB-11173 SS5]|uniref:uncharacterized protein n=1 Tax=Punctularia strigosozonata (strain HHB-11173) TaxID=741275 RepID=UPI00044181BE|nr:uncharacterized protein PUNSTDRAFT_142135 [Punctularia strigosozonata HHB-11173 SS5]EIN11927.1 hypothetical protein PUNSTDRAFT_142135 [Punctularia strigosozonata HHB-11173 SS5]
MAQAALMGPPLSPREPRRSGRRAPAPISTSSLTPDSPRPPDSPASAHTHSRKENGHRPTLSSANSSGSGRSKRSAKPDDHDDPHNALQEHPQNATSRTSPLTNSKNKRRTKDKERPPPIQILTEPGFTAPDNVEDGEVDPILGDEEDSSITRCICGRQDADDDSGNVPFMVFCEDCNVWQHGQCFGFESDAELDGVDWYCEQCRPDQHKELLKRAKSWKTRHGSQQPHRTSSAPATTTTLAPNARASRSQSPFRMPKQAKRRNTVNSRFDDSVQELLEATAAEAAAAAHQHHDEGSVNANETQTPDITTDIKEDLEEELVPGAASGPRRKRKRTDDDTRSVRSTKRTRSASTTSEQRTVSASVRDPTPVQVPTPKQQAVPLSAPPPPKRVKRGGARTKAQQLQEQLGVEADEAPTGVPAAVNRRQSGTGRGKGNQARQAADREEGGSGIGAGGSRKNNARDRDRDRDHMPNGTTQGVQGGAAGSSRNHQTHRERERDAFAASQQPLLTTWGLPDYLAHLSHILPSETPVPLIVEGIGEERGVKVRWPSKRMSVGDMNKRVRSLVEWVGREQASALERGRRREALEKALSETRRRPRTTEASDGPAAEGIAGDGDEALPNGDGGDNMVLDRTLTQSPIQGKDQDVAAAKNSARSTMTMMEELMEELISFQEKFSRTRS